MKLIAHRGLKTNGAKENSLASFQNAIKNPNYVGFELDIRTSKDGVFFVHHNFTVDKEILRFTDSKVLKEKYHLVTLEEVLKLNTNKIILIEIKEANLNVEAFCNLLNRFKMRNIYVDSFDNEVIKKIKEFGTFASLGVLNYVFNSEDSYHEYDFIGLLSPIVTEKLIVFFQKKNIEIFLYGITNKKELGAWDAIYYITDTILE